MHNNKLLNRISVLIFLIIKCDSDSMSIPEDADSKDPNICSSYRELARLPNPLAYRGNTCCENNTCFRNDANSPWGHVSELPECLNKILPEFLIFTPDNQTVHKLDYFNLYESSHNLSLTPGRQFFTIIHGWNTKWSKSWVIPMKDALIDLDYNVLVVNWTNGSNLKDYIQCVANTRSVGVAVSHVLKFLNGSNFISLSNTTIIGFSLGAHTAGYAGRNLPGLWRIIGLDPAGPLFVCEDTQARLDKSDAQFVLVIHSNGASVFDGGLGTLEQMGHIDFYPNGGLIQTGCDSASNGVANKLLHLDFSKLAQGISCSHTRGALIWIEVIKQYKLNSPDSCVYKSFPCNDSKSWKYGRCFDCGATNCPMPLLMADSINTPQKGKYYFNTLFDDAESGHYCGRQFRLTLTSNANAKGEIVVILKGPEGETNPLVFQKEWHILKNGIPRSEVFVAPWHITDITKILLTYKRYTNKFWINGIKKFTLVNATLTDSNENRLSISNSISITTEESVELNFF